VANNTSFTIDTAEVPSTTLSVDVFFDVLRTETVPAKKIIRKNRFVKINTSANPKGPWCLGFSDIHKVNKVYGSLSSYTTSGADITNQFNFDSGQKDTHYDYGYLYAKSSYVSSQYPYLLVLLDYFELDTSSGTGFFTVESYPVDDANTANTSAIQTKDIPVYVDESGFKNYLRDCIDFRTPSVPTANNTGTVDLANNTSVTAALAAATVNPSSTITFANSANLNNPSYGRNLQADYTLYLSRKDLLLITPDNVLKLKEGVSSRNPQTPIYPDNAMTLAVINIPAYPSLSSDQVNEFQELNRFSRTTIRDVSSAINCNVVTNRRYTMRDIGKLDQRITNLEYYAQLSLLEKNAKDLTVTDENGLDRFKNGIFVDPFSDSSLGDVSNPEYSIAIDSKKGVARPKIIREIVDIEFDEALSSNVTKTGRLITLNYDEIPFIIQPYATKFRSSALVAFAWNGTLILVPSFDNHNDDINTGSINIVVDRASEWLEFASSPLSTTWGDWRTSSSVETNSVVTGEQQIINEFNDLGALRTNAQGAFELAVQSFVNEGYNETVVRANLVLNWSGTDYVWRDGQLVRL
jgi:hypothetical protein